MTHNKAGGYISNIKFNNGKSVEINKNDIVIFVGPNNAGKSQSLKDIYKLSGVNEQGMVVSDVTITKYQYPISTMLDDFATYEGHGIYKHYHFLDRTYAMASYSEEDYQKSATHSSFCNLFVANLDTATRLLTCLPAKNIPRNANKTHPIHFATFKPEYRKKLSTNFKKAFGMELIPNTHYGAIIPLCMGEQVTLTEQFDDEQTRQEAYAGVLEQYKQVHMQGDGIISFTSILLYLMLDNFCTYLIDEPESFLHPPQAHIMGQIIGQELSSQQQAFISTHSEDIIKGLLDVCPERIKIIRITREEDINSFAVLDNSIFNDVWKDPLLKYSNIMSGLFHKSVVLCESDSDCKMYSIIESHIKQTAGTYSETLFIHCGGKQRMAKIAVALRALNVDVKLIPDIDVLNDEATFQKIVSAFDIDWTTIQNDYNVLVSNLHSPKEHIIRKEAQQIIDNILNSSKKDTLSNKEITDIRSTISTLSKWSIIKSTGIAGIPAGDATAAFNRINQILKNNNIFIVPVGELECFIKEIGGHGPDWVNKVIETYPNLNDNIYDKIKAFINELNS